MQVSTTFDVPVPPSRVFAFLSDPRNLIAANHPGPVVDRSDGPLAVGSWSVLAFDQVRVRVDYTAFEPDRRLGVTIVMTGRGARGVSSRQDFGLSTIGDGSGTRVEATVEGQGGWLRWGPIVRASQRAAWRRMRDRMVASA